MFLSDPLHLLRRVLRVKGEVEILNNCVNCYSILETRVV